MAVTAFKYSDSTTFLEIHPDVRKFIPRTHLNNFVVDNGDRWKLGSIGGPPSAIFLML